MIFLLLLTVAQSKSVTFSCTQPWELLDKHCYLDIFNQPWDVLSAPQTFMEAQKTCQSYGGTLPIVYDQKVARLLRDATGDVWLGLIHRSKSVVRKGPAFFKVILFFLLFLPFDRYTDVTEFCLSFVLLLFFVFSR